MHYLLICAASFFVSGLTLFSGFGLGTLLMPIFALFFPLPMAVALTAIVHFLNNLFKLVFWGRYADKAIVLKFGLPALVSAYVGAVTLVWLSDLRPLFSYQFFGRDVAVMPVKCAVALLMIFFSLFEVVPRFKKISFDQRYLSLGGVLSGFFGGLSGHQGALRSVFLVKCGLSPEGFIGTGVVIACLVDLSRILVYGIRLAGAGIQNNLPLLTAATLSAFCGVWLGGLLMKKVTLRIIQMIVGLLLFGIAVGLGLGIV